MGLEGGGEGGGVGGGREEGWGGGGRKGEMGGGESDREQQVWDWRGEGRVGA